MHYVAQYVKSVNGKKYNIILESLIYEEISFNSEPDNACYQSKQADCKLNL